MATATVPEFIQILRNIRDVIYPNMVAMESKSIRYDLKYGLDIDMIVEARLYKVNTNLPNSYATGELEVIGTILNEAIQSEITQILRDDVTGSKWQRKSVTGDGSDWTAWIERF